MDHKIIFEISQVENTKTNPLSAEEKAAKLQAKKEQQEKERREKLASAVAGMVVKRVGSEAANMVGDLTGNYYTQNQINNVATIAGLATSIMINPVIGGAALALSIGSSIVRETVSRTKQQYTIAYMKDLTGTTVTPQESKFGKGV